MEHDGKTWELGLRFQRHYKPYSFTLLNFTHERYPGTDLPKDFRSRVRVVNPAERHFVAIVVPLAAGMEPLNPNLETAPPEARPTGTLTLAPSYADYRDDLVAFYYDTLPKGTYDFYFRTRAQIPGRFIQPPAKAEMMYDGSVVGTGAGAWIEVRAK